MVCFPGFHGGERREEGKEQGEVGEGLGKMEEDMSVGELIKSTVHVDAEFCNARISRPGTYYMYSYMCMWCMSPKERMNCM